MKQIDIVKSSIIIKKALQKRFEELNLSYNMIVKESNKYDIKLTKHKLSVYFNHTSIQSGYPSQGQIIWLCFRYGIDLNLIIKPSPYDETEALNKVNLYYESKNGTNLKL